MVPRQIGVVVHPTRDVTPALDAVHTWAATHDTGVVQVPVPGNHREVAPVGDAESCQLIISIGGDGTMLAAIRAGAAVDRPVLGVACGSLGALTRTAPDDVADAIERFASGDWSVEPLPALTITRSDGPELLALNDIVVVRDGTGQIRVSIHVDGVEYARLAGDGVVVSTPLGSSAYALAAGGPLLVPGTTGYALTPLPAHGGAVPPLVLGPHARLALDVSPGYVGARLEVDGQAASPPPAALQIALRPAVARLVAFSDQEPLLAVLRRRGIVSDSPRALLDEERAGHGSDT